MPHRRTCRSVLAALLLAASSLAGAGAARAAGGPPTPAAAPLSAKHRAWLTRVSALIGDREREAFLALRRDYQRDAFIRRFWQVRDPYPQTARNELEEGWEERAKLVEERSLDFAEDRARILLLNGEPAEVFKGRCSQFLPLEIWSY